MEQLELFETEKTPLISLEDVFEAYYECRKNKRRSLNALRFEMNLEENLVQLWREINDGTYEIGQSIAFIVSQPVKREVFAAEFRDRIVHHLIVRKINPILEQAMSPHSYSCRKGMGTLYGVKKVFQYVKDCSCNYTKDCYVLRLDIRAFFMHIRHDKLYQMLRSLVLKNYHLPDRNLILSLIKQVVYYLPQKKCKIQGSFRNWKNLPKSKSLFYAGKRKGLPIGNLTSQIFANFYLNPFDRFVSMQNGIFYGRYVDDMVVIHQSKSFLLNFLKQIRVFLYQRYHLILHPRKTYLQHYVKGFTFIGAFLLPRRMYAGQRLKYQFFRKIYELSGMSMEKIMPVVNSYFGFLRHYNTLNLRLKGWEILQEKYRCVCVNKQVLKVFELKFVRL